MIKSFVAFVGYTIELSNKFITDFEKIVSSELWHIL